MQLRAEGAKSLLFVAFAFAVFVKMFIASTDVPWQSKYRLFGVPAFTYPGGDARNIQVTAHCGREGVPYFGDTECLRNAELVHRYYPDAHVPPLNYPSLWPRTYSLFRDDSEDFFMLFWTCNAILLATAIALLCIRYNSRLFPLVLFSPVTLR